MSHASPFFVTRASVPFPCHPCVLTSRQFFLVALLPPSRPLSFLTHDFNLIDESFKGDLRIKVEGHEIIAHKVFLCSRSEYFKLFCCGLPCMLIKYCFRAMLKGGMQESNTELITDRKSVV